MVFHSPNFLVFFILLLIPILLFRRHRVWLLAVANIIFYGAAGLGVLAVFLCVTLITYLCMHGMKRNTVFFWFGIGTNVLNLVFFKYTVFLLTTIEAWTGSSFWFSPSFAHSIVLPVGISFYTFQLISYLIDVRRGDLEPTRSFLKFWVYISLFPQLVAGPIMRGDELMPQLDELHTRRIRWSEIKFGVYLFMVGLIKKILLADPISEMVNPLFAKGMDINAVESWMASYAFGFQIYYDFSAYSDMALGLGYMLGVKLVLNFNSPYISSNPSEFWRRWHITLSRWIRDYIYIGLGGNRKGPVRVQLNLFAAMVISGLWHGAMWTFVLWGAVHGLLLIVYKGTLWFNRYQGIKWMRGTLGYRIAATVIFFHIVTWTWVFFRAENIDQALHMTKQMMFVSWPDLFMQPEMVWIGLFYLLHLLEWLMRRDEAKSAKWWHVVPFPVRSAVYAVMIFAVFYFQRGETYDFIYFQF